MAKNVSVQMSDNLVEEIEQQKADDESRSEAIRRFVRRGMTVEIEADGGVEDTVDETREAVDGVRRDLDELTGTVETVTSLGTAAVWSLVLGAVYVGLTRAGVLTGTAAAVAGVGVLLPLLRFAGARYLAPLVLGGT